MSPEVQKTDEEWRQELSPEQAQANVTYLRSMLAQQNAWSQLKKDDKDKETNTN